MLLQYILSDFEKSSQPAVVCAEQGRTFSYARLADMSQELAAQFMHQGLLPGDRVAILLPNSIEFVTSLFGALIAGATAAPLDIYLKRDDLLTILATIKPRILVTNHHLLRKIRADLRDVMVCIAEFDAGIGVRFSESGPSGIDNWRTLGQEASAGRSLFPRLNPAQDAVLIMSSGTTGIPKAVRLSHRAVLHNISMHLESLDLEPGVRGLQVLPMNFSYGLIASFLSILYLGGTAVLMPVLDTARVQQALQRYQVNLFMGTPTIFQYLIENGGPGPGLAAAPLEYLTVGGDRCKLYTLNLIRSQLPGAKIYITYGLSEAGPRVSTLSYERVADLPDSIGLPLKGVEVAILDRDGNRCAPRELGEIVVKSPSLMSGYFGNEARTKKVIRDGLCYTGDIGYLDDDGFLYYRGRKDRQFKFGGRNVHPAFIEQCLASHPQVQEVTVTKIDGERDELICARIKAKNVAEEEFFRELKRHCLKQMPAYMVPGKFILEEHDHYYYKGKRFFPVREQLPALPALNINSGSLIETPEKVGQG